jgi:hypothetical protein
MDLGLFRILVEDIHTTDVKLLVASNKTMVVMYDMPSPSNTHRLLKSLAKAIENGFRIYCLVMSCRVLSCLVLSRLVSSCLVLSCLVLSRLVLSFLVSSCLVSSCLVSSNHFENIDRNKDGHYLDHYIDHYRDREGFGRRAVEAGV